MSISAFHSLKSIFNLYPSFPCLLSSGSLTLLLSSFNFCAEDENIIRWLFSYPQDSSPRISPHTPPPLPFNIHPYTNIFPHHPCYQPLLSHYTSLTLLERKEKICVRRMYTRKKKAAQRKTSQSKITQRKSCLKVCATLGLATTVVP